MTSRIPQPAILRSLTNALLNDVVPLLEEPVLVRVQVTEDDVTAQSGWDPYNRRWTARITRADRVEMWSLHLGRRQWSLEDITKEPGRWT